MVRVRYLGHSVIALDSGDACVLIDPFFTGNPFCPEVPADLRPTHILLTHGHGDHVGDAPAIARATGAPIFAVPELGKFIEGDGVKVILGNHGGTTPFPFGSVQMTFAYHSSSSTADRIYTGLPCGLVIEIGGRRIYHAGDTSLFGDMQYIGRKGLDLACLPIGDRFTMGPDDALIACDLLKPKTVLPMHYNTWPMIRQDAAAFAQRVEAAYGIACQIAGPPGEFYI